MRFGQRPQRGALARLYRAPYRNTEHTGDASDGTAHETEHGPAQGITSPDSTTTAGVGGSETPTTQLEPAPEETPVYGPSLPSESTIHVVLDLAMRIGEFQMASGAGAADATATIIAVTSTYGIRNCEVDVIFTSISVCYHRGTELAPIYSLRVVRPRGTDYTRLVQVEQLVGRITGGKLRATDAIVELERIITTGHRYPRWAATLAWGGMSSSIAVLLGGGPLVASISFVIAAVIDRVGILLNKRGLPHFFQQLVGGALATAMALGVGYGHLFKDPPSATLLIGAALTVLLSGLSVVSTAQDAVTGYYLTAAARTVQIVLASAGLIAGVVIALDLAVRIGLPDASGIANKLTPTPFDLPIEVFAGAFAAAFFALAAYSGPRIMVVSGIAGGVGALAYNALALTAYNEIARAAVAAVLIGFGGGLLARRLRLPPVVVAVSGLVPLLPGYTTYKALYALAVQSDQSNAGLPNLMVAVAIAVALGAGVVFGQFLAQPVRTGMGRLGRRISGPRMAGPLRPFRRRLE